MQGGHAALDVQYFLFHYDTTGKMVAASLVAAADRGASVRLPIDDTDTADKELGRATLNAHPNIQVWLSNPLHTPRSTSLLVRGWQALRDSVRLNRRLHNLIVDPPEKVPGRDKSPSKLLIGQLAGLWINPARRVLIVPAHFVPGATGMTYFEYWRSQGGQVDTLTNTYAASDVPIVHAGHANYASRCSKPASTSTS